MLNNPELSGKISRPFGDDGPTVVFLDESLQPQPGSELSSWDMRVLRKIPKNGISLRTLAENLHMLGAYADFEKIVQKLDDNGYLKVKDGRATLTKKGKSELS